VKVVVMGEKEPERHKGVWIGCCPGSLSIGVGEWEWQGNAEGWQPVDSTDPC
jgi:hypothetical protein